MLTNKAFLLRLYWTSFAWNHGDGKKMISIDVLMYKYAQSELLDIYFLLYFQILPSPKVFKIKSIVAALIFPKNLCFGIVLFSSGLFCYNIHIASLIRLFYSGITYSNVAVSDNYINCKLTL